MTLSSSMKTILTALLLVISIPAGFFFWKMPAAKLSTTENELVNFSSTPLSLSSTRPQAIFSGLDYPVRVTPKQSAPAASAEAAKQTPPAATGTKSFPPGPIPAANVPVVVSRPIQRNSFDSQHVVSMIYSEGSIKTAIIDGQVVHEGTTLGASQIVAIEKTRVLIRTAGKDLWLNID